MSFKKIKFSKRTEITSYTSIGDRCESEYGQSNNNIASSSTRISRSLTRTPTNISTHNYNLRSGKKYDSNNSNSFTIISAPASKSNFESEINIVTGCIQLKEIKDLNWWDIRPKTDYTYSHTTTYRSNGLDHSPPPNMSRRLLRSNVKIKDKMYDSNDRTAYYKLRSQHERKSSSKDTSTSGLLTYESCVDENSKDDTTEKNLNVESVNSLSIFYRFSSYFFTLFSQVASYFIRTTDNSSSSASTYARTKPVRIETVNVAGVNKSRIVVVDETRNFLSLLRVLKPSFFDEFSNNLYVNFDKKLIKRWIFWIFVILLLLFIIWFFWCSFIVRNVNDINDELNMHHYESEYNINQLQNAPNLNYNKLNNDIKSLEDEFEKIGINSNYITQLIQNQEILEKQFSQINATIESFINIAIKNDNVKKGESLNILRQELIREIDEKLNILLKLHSKETYNRYISEYHESLSNIKEHFSLLYKNDYGAINNLNNSFNNLQENFKNHSDFLALEIKIINDKLAKLELTSDKMIPLFDIINSIKFDISLFDIDDLKLKLFNLQLSINSTNNYIEKLRSVINDQEKRISVLENNQDNMELFIQKTIQSEIKKKFDHLNKAENTNVCLKCNLDSDVNKLPFLTKSHVSLMVKEAIDLYSADRLGLVDYALESSGGSIISTRCSKTHTKRFGMYTIFGIPFWYLTSNPRWIIQPENLPGNCWAMEGSSGNIIIQLSDKITPSAFTLEHISAKISPEGSINSAPKNFSVYALNSPRDKLGENMGNFTYDKNGEPLQTFSVMRMINGVRIVELKIESNHGNPEYTCIYRFRVHGKRDG